MSLGYLNENSLYDISKIGVADSLGIIDFSFNITDSVNVIYFTNLACVSKVYRLDSCLVNCKQ